MKTFSETIQIDCDVLVIGDGGAGLSAAINAKTVILATGGFAQLYENNNNAFGITGDGHVLAYNLGVPLRDMEFVQFYTTWGTFYEFTVAMGGATLKNSKNEDILKKHGFMDPKSVTRDQLSIAVFSEIQQGLDVDGGVVLDFESVSEEFMERLQDSLPKSLSGIDKVQVVKPTAHFCMGGVTADEMGMTGVNGLFVAGEICGGVHGANRLGGNALAEVFSMGRITGKRAGEYAEQNDPIRLTDALFNEEAALPEVSINGIRELMRYIELKNMLTLSKILCRAALLREESRGSHYRSDFPDEDNDNWLKSIFVRKENTGMKLELSPVDEETLRKFDIEI